MKKLSFLALFFLVLTFLFSLGIGGNPSYASGISDPASANSLETVRQDDIKHLIETLESDTARQDLITNLKLLLNQEKNTQQDSLPEVIPALTEHLGFRGKIYQMLKEYNKFLDKNSISSSLLNQSLGTVIVLCVGIVLLLMGRKASLKAIKSLNALSERIGIRLTRIAFYARFLQWILRLVVGGIGLYTISKIWEFGIISKFFEGAAMRGFLSTAATTILVAIVSAFIWESIGIYLAYILKQADGKNQTRVTTLLPMFRNIIMTFVGILFGLVLFSELGINVGPLIAGAGVIGVAIGFGAQNMVKDFITGFTILLEDVIRVGDVVTLDGCTGAVEKITLRKVQLRDVSGIVYTIPFSQITTVQNQTKNYSYYVMDIGVAYNQSTDRVVEILREVDDSLRGDEKFGSLILAPLDVFGVERFDDSAVIIRARLKTKPVRQWEVGREYNRRMKIAFDKYGIEIPFPQRVVTVVNTGGAGPTDISKIAKAAD